MADTINLDASQKVVSVQGLDHYHTKAMSQVDKKIEECTDGFLQNLGFLDSGSLLDYVLTLKESGFLFVSSNVTDTPVEGQFFFVDVRRHTNGSYGITATRFNAKGVYTNRYNSADDRKNWYGWANVADGGDADTVDGLHAGAFLTGAVLSVVNSLDDLTTPGVYGVHATEVSGALEIYGAWGICDVRLYGSVCYQTIKFETGNIINRAKVIGQSEWTDWAKINDGGNAATLEGFHANEIAENSNLLTNPDFKVNQRGALSYTSAGYTVDDWKISSNSKLTTQDGYISFENTTNNGVPSLYQICETPAELSGETVTLSFDCDLKTEGAFITIQILANGSWYPASSKRLSDTGRGVKSVVITLPDNLTELRAALIIHTTDTAPLAQVDIYSAKLELSSIASPFAPPNPATELAKCQRYYQIRSTGDVLPADLRPSMRLTPTVTTLSDGNFAYNAEL